jgi:hypothetical protein
MKPTPRHFTGWTPPPHPFDVIPSIDGSMSKVEQVRRVLLDWEHDDDLRATFFHQPGNTHYWIFSPPNNLSYTEGIMEAWFNPTQLSKDQLGAFSEVDIGKWLDDNHVADKINNALAKRLKIGPLPPNDYSNGYATIYYYDNDHLKKVIYPQTAISTASGYALDPNNKYWWKGNGITTAQRNDDGSWGDEGFDWNKDFEGVISTVASIIMAIVGIVLLATGVGAAAGAAILAFSAALVAEANMIATGLSGGDISVALGGFINAITKLVGAELPPGVLTQLGKPLLQLLAVQLKALIPLVKSTQGQSFTDSYATIKSQLENFGPITDQSKAALDALLGNASQPFDAGYKIADYSDPATIDGILGMMQASGVEPAAVELFKLGATLGLMRRDQKAGAAFQISTVPAKYAQRATALSIANVSPSAVQHQLNTKADLMAYINGTLQPRYGLSF